MLSRLFITTGDADGVGLEVTAKALSKFKIPRGQQVFVFVGPQSEKKYVRLIFRRANGAHDSLSSALAAADENKNRKLFLVISKSSPPEWVVASTSYCAKHPLHSALITAPMSKGLIRRAGYSALGHTELIADTIKIRRDHLFMGFIGTEFSVVLATGHLPLEKVARALTLSQLQRSLRAAQNLLSLLPTSRRNKKIGLLGLNPHAGDENLIGKFESSRLIPFVQASKRRGVQLSNPIVPDAAFLPNQRRKYAVYIALYHDQGLIPFKALHGAEAGIHITLGLPFIRTSVDHGTAKDIFGKGKAQAGSMLDAISFASRSVGVIL